MRGGKQAGMQADGPPSSWARARTCNPDKGCRKRWADHAEQRQVEQAGKVTQEARQAPLAGQASQPASKRARTCRRSIAPSPSGRHTRSSMRPICSRQGQEQGQPQHGRQACWGMQTGGLAPYKTLPSTQHATAATAGATAAPVCCRLHQAGRQPRAARQTCRRRHSPRGRPGSRLGALRIRGWRLPGSRRG